MEKKYKLTEETINVGGTALYRIEALRDFGDVKKGDKGGFIEKEDNLSQSDNCWVYGNAKVCDKAMVYGNARVCENAVVCGYARVYDNARVYNNAVVGGKAVVYGNAVVDWYAVIYGNAEVYDNAVVGGNAEIRGNAVVYRNAKVCDDSLVRDNAKVCGNAEVFGHAAICGDTIITSNSDYIVFKNWWSSGRYFTWTKSNNMWKVGCFHGTGKELIEKAYKDSELSGREYERVVKYVESIIADNGKDK